MKILFIATSGIPIHNHILEERPLGGTETGVVRLAQNLKMLGATVYVATALENPPLSDPLYLPARAIQDIGAVDVVVGVRSWQSAIALPAPVRFFWTGDSASLPQTVGVGDKRFYNSIDRMLCVSDWHANTMCDVSGFPRSKAHVLRNGVELKLFEASPTRNKQQLLYTTTPFRGLEHLIALYPKIKAAVPTASLKVISGYDVYKGSPVDQQMVQRKEKIFAALRALSDVTVCENMLQKDLAHELSQGGIYAYPNTFAETSCISVLEAHAAGVPVITTKRAALTETVGAGGIVIEGEPGTDSYNQKFIESTVSLLKNQAAWEDLHQKALAQAKNYDWSSRAKEFLVLCQGCLQKKNS